jgi:hypothetical protein
MIFVILVIGFLFICSTAATLAIKREATVIQQKYDTVTKCEDLHTLYSDDQLRSIAVDDWYVYYMSPIKQEVVSGILGCFCKE